MILLLTNDPSIARAVRAAVPAGTPLRVAGWHELERETPLAWVLVAHVPERAGREAAQRLRRLGTRLPTLPVIVVAPRSPDLLVDLLNVGVSATVWADAIAVDLPGALAHARGRGLAERIAAALEGSPRFSPSLRGALAAAFRNPVPPRRVCDLAQMAHCDRTTLWKHWRAELGEEMPLQPGQFVDWALLVRAALRKHEGRRWHAVAAELGIHEHTLTRLARRLVGCTLREVEAGGRALLLERFEQRVLAVLCRPPGEPALPLRRAS